jgi:hypothetical protein
MFAFSSRACSNFFDTFAERNTDGIDGALFKEVIPEETEAGSLLAQRMPLSPRWVSDHQATSDGEQTEGHFATSTKSML